MPRSEWQTHPHYPRQVLLLGSHENFRRISTHLVHESLKHWSATPSAPPLRDHFALFRRWKSAMKGHEGYEEGKLYPYLRARYGVSTTKLQRDHAELGRADEHVRAAFREGDSLRASHALERHNAVLVPHLAREEDTVIPLLLAMSPDEFRRYSSGSIGNLLGPAARAYEAQKRSSDG